MSGSKSGGHDRTETTTNRARINNNNNNNNNNRNNNDKDKDEIRVHFCGIEGERLQAFCLLNICACYANNKKSIEEDGKQTRSFELARD